jgi:hypothetical protein
MMTFNGLTLDNSPIFRRVIQVVCDLARRPLSGLRILDLDKIKSPTCQSLNHCQFETLTRSSDAIYPLLSLQTIFGPTLHTPGPVSDSSFSRDTPQGALSLFAKPISQFSNGTG